MPYSFRANAGAWYQQARYREFIVNEVRTRLNAAGGTFTIEMRDDTTNNVMTMTVRASDLYITHLNGNAIPAHLINYGNNGVLINQREIDNAFAEARTFNGHQGPNTEKTVRVLPFLFAEAARFPIVNYAVGRVFNGNATYRWSDFRDIIRSWQVLCNHATTNGMVPGDATMGGGGKFAPIEPGVILSYNAQAGVKLKVPPRVGM